MRIFSLLALIAMIVSCKNSEPLQKGDYFLRKNTFLGNKSIASEELYQIIPFSQKANSRPLNLPITPKVWWYNIGANSFNEQKHQLKLERAIQQSTAIPNEAFKKKQAIDRRINRIKENLAKKNSWFWRSIGEKQVVSNAKAANETAVKIQKYYFDAGFRDAAVAVKEESSHKKRNVLFEIQENQPYLIDSVMYNFQDASIAQLVQQTSRNAKVKIGDRFDLKLINAEKTRIESLLKNNGYYLFSVQSLDAVASNANHSEAEFNKNKSGDLIISTIEGSNTQKFNISEVVFKSFDPSRVNSNAKPDTVVNNGVKFIRVDQNIPIGVVSKRILTKNGGRYNISEIQESQRQISLFNQFSFASTQIKPLTDNQVSLEYFAPLLEKYTFAISPGINNIYSQGSSFFGFGVPVSITTRNRFEKLETLEASVSVSYEGQPTPVDQSLSPIRGSLEIATNLSLTIPQFYPNFFKKYYLKNPRTILSVGYNYSEPFWGQRQKLHLNTNYALQVSKNATLFVSFFDVNLINTVYSNNDSGRSFYNSLVDLQNLGNNLKVTFDPQFVSSINSNFVYNDQVLGDTYGNAKFFRLFVESGGTLMNFGKDKDRVRWVEDIFPLNVSDNSVDTVRSYFRFVKISADYRRSKQISRSSSYAYKVNLGLTNPYGANRSLPYDKNFFIGGSNSIRAWSPRTLGAGSAVSDTTSAGNIIPQPGDIILESSIEYRRRLISKNLQFAVFLDAGNIWKWYQVDTEAKRNKSNFDANRFYKEIALGTGFGLRLDLTYFLIRLDWGIKILDPSRADGDRFVIDEFTLKRNNNYGLTWNFGIGYPF